MIDIVIDLFVWEDRYILRITTVHLCVYNPDYNREMRAYANRYLVSWQRISKHRRYAESTGNIWDCDRIPMHSNTKYYAFYLDNSITTVLLHVILHNCSRNAWSKHRIVTSPFIAHSLQQNCWTDCLVLFWTIFHGHFHGISCDTCENRYEIREFNEGIIDRIRFGNRDGLSVSIGSIGNTTKLWISTNSQRVTDILL